MNLDRLLQIQPEYRKRRNLTAGELRKALTRGPRQCTWCGLEVGRTRQTWCGDACVDAFRERCDGSYRRRAVFKRDLGKCSLCRVDTRAGRKQFGRYPKVKDREAASKVGYCIASGNWWEADHIVPVARGGGLCPLSGMRTLCGNCHKAETARVFGGGG